jgi:hypothetical protein
MKHKIGIVFITIFLFFLQLTQVCVAIEDEEFERVKALLQSGNMIESLNEIKRIERSGLPLESMQELLRPVFSRDDIRLASLAVRLLHSAGDIESVGYLQQFLDEAHPVTIRVRAVKTLMELADESLMERLLARVSTEELPVALAIIEAVLARGGADAAGLISEEHIATLLAAFESADSSAKLKALWIAQKLEKRALPIIAAALEDSDPAVQQEAFHVASRIGAEKIKQLLLPFTQVEDTRTVYQAAFALGIMGEPGFYRFIKRDLTSDDSDAQHCALSFLRSKVGFGSEDHFFDTIKRLAVYASDDDTKKAAREYIERYENIISRKTAEPLQ